MADTFVISSSGRATIQKDPDAILDYTWDWSLWLADIPDTISSAVLVLDAGLVEVDKQIIDANTKVVGVISGGNPNENLKAVCRITTVGGLVDDRTIYLKIKER